MIAVAASAARTCLHIGSDSLARRERPGWLTALLCATNLSTRIADPWDSLTEQSLACIFDQLSGVFFSFCYDTDAGCVPGQPVL